MKIFVVFKSYESITQELLEEISKKATGVFTQQKNIHMTCPFMGIQTCIYKEASGVFDDTVHGKDALDVVQLPDTH